MASSRTLAILGAPIRGLKALTSAIFPASSGGWGALFGAGAQIQRKVGDGGENSIVVATIGWLQRNFPQAPLRIRELAADGETYTPILPGDMGAARMLALLDQPNGFYDWGALAKATVASLKLDGNAYWLEVTNNAGAPLEYWWVPHTLIEPKRRDGSSEFITHYAYTPGGGMPVDLDVDSVVHFRDGIDPSNPMKGASAVKAVLREVYTDEEAAEYTSTLLANMGVPGIVVSPDGDGAPGAPNPGDDELRQVKAKFEAATTGSNRGRAIIMRGATKLQTFGFNPQQMSLRELRRVPEERITAALGVPAIVAGMGAGLDRSTFNNMGEARETAVEEALIPLWNDVARVIKTRILPRFERPERARRMLVDFDLSDVRVLREDQDKIATRMTELFRAGIVTRAQAKEPLGLSIDPADDVYLLPLAVMEVPAGSSMYDVGGDDAAAAVVDPKARGEKAGRVLSRANATELAAAFDALRVVLERAGVVLDPEAESAEGKAMRAVAVASDEVKRLSRRQQAALILALEADQQVLAKGFADRLVKRFDDLGRRAVEAWQAQDATISPASDTGKGLKAGEEQQLAPHEAAAAARAIAAVEVDEFRQKVMQPEYARHYDQVARRTLSTLTSNLGIEIGNPDHVAVEVLKQHGKQVGLLDLSTQTRQAMFQALADGKAAGEGPPAIERRIRDYVTSGSRGSSVDARAMRIARTETMHAQRVSTRTAYEISGAFDTVVAFDNRLGYDDPDCVARNGETFTFEQAEMEEAEEHPNGTLSWAPGSIRE